MFPVTTKILIVDDTALMRRMMRDFFTTQGYKLVTDANDGEAAWREYEKAVVEKNPFQLIVSDWNMPKLTGLDFLKLVRGSDAGKTVPFFMLTAETEKDRVVEAIQNGVTGYITKPFTQDVVRTKLKAAWDAAAAKKAS